MSNIEYRELANEFAAFLAAALNKPAPKCKRINRRRGFAYHTKNTFSVPAWAMKGHRAYRAYYILHEATHCFSGTPGHGPTFQEVEDRCLAMVWLEIVRGRDHYPIEVRKPGAGKALCGKRGEPI